jgi:hypothetical protein
MSCCVACGLATVFHFAALVAGHQVAPGIGMFMLGALATTFLAPVFAAGFAVAAFIRQPGVALNWLDLGLSAAALIGQAALFASARWL